MKQINKTNKYWVRTALGLEELFLQELKELFLPINISLKHKSVFFELQDEKYLDKKLITSLKTADDIYRFYGYCNGIDNTKASTEKIVEYFRCQILPALKKLPNKQFVRITVSFLGSRNYNRFFIENAISGLVKNETSHVILSNEQEEKWKEGELRIRIHIEDDSAYFGIGLKDIPLHRRQWRSQSYNAQLHPPIAAAMAKIAIATNNSTFIDPFCGSGTILIEAALQKNELNYIGFDTERSAIQIATENSRLANTRIAFYNANFYNSFNDMEDYFIISNPPWGEKHLIDSESEEIFIKKLIEIISKSRGALLLIPKEINQKILDKGMKGEEKFQTRIRGKLVSIFHFK